MPQSLTINGEKFEVPDAVLAKYDSYLTPEAPEGLRASIRQTLVENLRNNFASKVKNALNGDDDAGIPAEAKAALDAEFATYADKYEFGVRTGGGGGGRTPADPVEREMSKLAKDELVIVYIDKYDEKPPKDWPTAELIETYIGRRHDDLAQRARAIVNARAKKREPQSEAAMDLV